VYSLNHLPSGLLSLSQMDMEKAPYFWRLFGVGTNLATGADAGVAVGVRSAVQRQQRVAFLGIFWQQNRHCLVQSGRKRRAQMIPKGPRNKPKKSPSADLSTSSAKRAPTMAQMTATGKQTQTRAKGSMRASAMRDKGDYGVVGLGRSAAVGRRVASLSIPPAATAPRGSAGADFFPSASWSCGVPP
jgi:hypothetical protein